MESIVALLTPKKNTFFINENNTVRQALEKFDAHKFTVIPLVNDEGRYIGTLSEGDILRFMKNQANFNLTIAENFLIKDIDHYRPYEFVRIDASIEDVFELSLKQNFIPVTDDNAIYIGIIKRRDIIEYLFRNR